MTFSHPNRLRGDLWAVVSALTTGCGLIAVKLLLETINPISLNMYIFMVGGILIAIDAVSSGRLRETLTINKRQMTFMLFITLIFCMALFCLMSALMIAEPATVSFLSRLELIATLFFAAIFLKERINRAEIIGLVVVILGIIILRSGGTAALNKALLLITASSLLIGFGEVLIKARIDWINHRSFIFYRNMLGAGLFFIVGSINGNLTRPDDWSGWGLIAISGLCLPYLGRLGYLKAMKNITVSRASIIVQSQPFFAAGAALLILGTLPPLNEIAGGMLIVSGVVIMKLLEMRYRNRSSPAEEASNN